MTSAVPSSSTRHRGRRAGLTAVLAGALVAGSAVLATTAAAPANAIDYGTDLITLQTGATNKVTLHQGATDTDQPLSPSGCRITSTGPVVAFGGSGNVGLRQGSIGIINGGSGESCGQVNAPAERLDLDLKGKVASQAVLDLELQKNAVVLATLTGGAEPVYLELQTGSSITNQRTASTAGGAPAGKTVTLATCQVESSSSSNNFTSDNCRWVINATFSAISLKAITGNVSLEGGADGTVSRLSTTAGVRDTEPIDAAKAFTYFKLLELCTEQNTLTTIASTGGTGLPSGLVKRSVKNLDGSLCLEDGLTAEAKDANTVDIIKRGQPFGQYVTKIDWNKAPTTTAALSEAINRTTIEFDIGLGPNTLSPAKVLPWCPTSLFDPATSEVEPLTGARILSPLPASVTAGGVTESELQAYNISDMDGVTSNAVQFACIQDRDVRYNAGTFVVSDVIYVLGDLRMRS